MAAIITGEILIDGVVRGDMLDVSFDVEHNLDLGSKTLYAEVRRGQDTDVVLKFQESDGSLVKTIVSPTAFTLKFYKPASAMQNLTGTYYTQVAMGTDPDFEDKQTIIEGTFVMKDEYTEKP